jgi:Tol biopolymer transport system component
LYASSENKFATSWSPDGRYLVYNTQGDIWALPLEGSGKHVPLPLLNTGGNESSGRVSRDGRWLAYVSDESGAAEIYVQPFAPAPGDSPPGPKILVSRGGGYGPHWQADGKAIFYHGADSMLRSVAIQESSGIIKPGSPQALFHLNRQWDLAGDGSRFLVAVPEAQTSQPPFTMVLNWQAELKK